ncbi:MAG: ATP synthase F1 subunit gamma [Eubacterium sp.]|nr:ATP synthase F1 subunit gamma [Candidatus Colimonas fimequi]
MAESMQDIKRRIKSITSTEHITNAMKLVSAGKLRKARAIFEKTNENSHYITNAIEDLFTNSDDIPDKYLEGGNTNDGTCFIVITSNKGLCGGFNSNVIKEAEATMKLTSGHKVVIAIGSRGKEYFEKRGYEIYRDYTLPPEEITFLEAKELCEPIIDMYEKGEIGRVILVSTSFVSSMEQQVTNMTLLPFPAENNPEVGVGTGKFIDYEPSVEAVFNYLVPKYVEMMVYAAVVESATCEHAARRTAMENATDNAREMLDDLSLFYNRARQAAITDEIIEIVAGSEAQK